jgi:hypothetical protein
MVEASKDTCLAVELLLCLAARFVIGGRIRLGLFDRAEAPIEPEVFSLVDATHPAAADNLADAVPFT